ncbi:hypothetical protein VTL71DRAFT_1581, partial [Oculimacula yallundae]
MMTGLLVNILYTSRYNIGSLEQAGLDEPQTRNRADMIFSSQVVKYISTITWIVVSYNFKFPETFARTCLLTSESDNCSSTKHQLRV